MSPLTALLLIPAVATAALLLSCVNPCENTILADSPSPGANKRAVVFDRACGATTGSSRQVSVLDVHKKLAGSGNVFVADSNHGAVTEMVVAVRWASRDQVVIRYPARARVFKKETQSRGVAVAYETVP